MLRRGPVLLTTLWAAAAVVATGVGLLAIQLVAGELGGSGPRALDNEAVQEALGSPSPAASPSATVSRSPRPTASPTSVTPPSSSPGASAQAGPIRTVSTRGGVVSARCVGGEPRLVVATPADGFRIDDSSGSRVTFESERYEVKVRLGCDWSNRVTSSVRTEDREDEQPSPSPSPSDDESSSPEPSESPDPEPSDDD